MDDDDFMDDEEEYDLVRSCSHCSQFLNWYIKPIMISVFECVFVCVCVCVRACVHAKQSVITHKILNKFQISIIDVQDPKYLSDSESN